MMNWRRSKRFILLFFLRVSSFATVKQEYCNELFKIRYETTRRQFRLRETKSDTVQIKGKFPGEVSSVPKGVLLFLAQLFLSLPFTWPSPSCLLPLKNSYTIVPFYLHFLIGLFPFGWPQNIFSGKPEKIKRSFPLCCSSGASASGTLPIEIHSLLFYGGPIKLSTLTTRN